MSVPSIHSFRGLAPTNRFGELVATHTETCLSTDEQMVGDDEKASTCMIGRRVTEE